MAEHIQIGAVVPRIQYAADGAQTQFTYPFPVFQAADLEVWLDDALQASGFAVTGTGQSAGGSVIFAAPPGNGIVVTLRRRLDIRRLSDFQEGGDFRAKVLNDELDYQTAAIQQVADDVSRAVRLDPSAPAAFDPALPAPAADKVVAINAAGTGFEYRAASDFAGPPGPEGPPGGLANLGDAAPLAAGTGAPGVSTLVSRQDHVHPKGTRVDGPAATTQDRVPQWDAAARTLKDGLAVGTAAGNLVQLDAAARLPAVDGSQLTGIVAAGTDQKARDIAIAAYVKADLAGSDAAGLYGPAFSDDFETDTLGAASTDEVYDGTNKLYYSASTQTLIPQATGTPIGTLTAGSGLGAAFNGNDNEGYASSAWAAAAGDPGQIGKDLGAGGARKIASVTAWSTNDQGWDTTSASGSPTLTLKASNTGLGQNAVTLGSTSVTENNGRVSGTVNSADTTAAYRYVWIELSGGGQRWCVAEVYFYEATVFNMILQSGTATLAAEPNDVALYLLVEEGDALTLGTDLVAAASIDGGATWANAGAYAVVGTWTGQGKLVRCDINVTAQVGTSLKWRLTTANNKAWKLRQVTGFAA